MGDEGGYAPNLKRDEDAFKCIVAAIEKAGYKPGEDLSLIHISPFHHLRHLYGSHGYIACRPCLGT